MFQQRSYNSQSSLYQVQQDTHFLVIFQRPARQEPVYSRQQSLQRQREVGEEGYIDTVREAETFICHMHKSSDILNLQALRNIAVFNIKIVELIK